jgi:hypothetical protein
MANEISVSASCTITQAGQSVSGSKSFNANLSSTSFLGQEVTIGSTTAALVYMAGLTNPSTVLVINQDTTNFITIDNILALSNFPQKLLPGQAVLLLPETGTIYAKADTAPCQAWIVAG